MGTEVLWPPACVRHSLTPSFFPSSSTYLPRGKLHEESHKHSRTDSYTNPNPDANPRINRLLNNNHFNAKANPPSRRAVAKKRKKVASLQPAVVMGQVTILKRGESLEEKVSGFLSNERKRSESGGVLSSEAGGDLIVPERKTRIAAPVMYAGSVCSVSPSPSALPLPTFSMKKAPQSCTEQSAASVDLSATEHLRRLLRLA